MNHIIVCGDPTIGFEFYGPFESEEKAIAFAEKDGVAIDRHWWVALLQGEDEDDEIGEEG